jgi:flagellin FlaB
LAKNSYSTFVKTLANMHSQRGMTGLETAIILIAFVTVAAVFGYAILSSGLFSAERSKETVYAGLKQAKANMELSGSVIVKSDNVTNKATEILFTVRNAVAGTPIDMTPNGVAADHANRCVISLATTRAYYNNVQWTVDLIGASDGDNLLESGEQIEIIIDLADLGTGFADPAIGANDWFNIQVKPMLGSTMTIQRTLPAGLDPVMDMH